MIIKFLKEGYNAYYVGGLLTLVLLYFIFKDKADSKVYELTGKSQEWIDTPESQANNNNILKKGSRGAEVVLLQKWLKSKGADLGTYGPGKDGVDGVFGQVTEDSLFSILGVRQTTLADIILSNAVASNVAKDAVGNPDQYQYMN